MEAKRKFGLQVPLRNLDARSLPAIQPAAGLPKGRAFHLILLLNDVLNYMTEDGDLEQLFAGVKRNLSSDHGLAVFDANTLSLFQRDFASGSTDLDGGREWQGLTASVRPQGMYEARFSGPGVEAHIHRQRHWTVGQVVEALDASGLSCLAALGQREEPGRIVLTGHPDEERDEKTIYIAGHSPISPNRQS